MILIKEKIILSMHFENSVVAFEKKQDHLSNHNITID